MLATLLSAGALLACAGEPPPPARDPWLTTIETAEAAFASGRFDEAARAFRRSLALAETQLRRNEATAEAHLGLARTYGARRSFRTARQHLGRARFAAKQGPGRRDRLWARIELAAGQLHLASGGRESAVAAFETARERLAGEAPDDPLVADVEMQLGLAHAHGFEYLQALEAFGRAADCRDPRRRERAAAWRLGLRARAGIGAITPGELEGLPPMAPDEAENVAALAAFARGWIAERRFHEAHFDLEHHRIVSLRRLHRGLGRRESEALLAADLTEEFHAFAPPSAAPAGREPGYALPYAGAARRRVADVPARAHPDAAGWTHALDFELPAGTVVRAARAGRVVRAVDGHPETGTHGEHANRVIVLHEDGSYATYRPLAPGLGVAEGEPVVAGQPLGRSTGRALHFDLRHNVVAAGRVRPIALRPRFFGLPATRGLARPGEWLGGETRPAAQERDAGHVPARAPRRSSP